MLGRQEESQIRGMVNLLAKHELLESRVGLSVESEMEATTACWDLDSAHYPWAFLEKLVVVSRPRLVESQLGRVYEMADIGRYWLAAAQYNEQFSEGTSCFSRSIYASRPPSQCTGRCLQSGLWSLFCPTCYCDDQIDFADGQIHPPSMVSDHVTWRSGSPPVWPAELGGRPPWRTKPVSTAS